MKEIKVNYPYEWEYKALDEVKRCLIAAWWKDHDKWTTLHEENKQAINLLRKDGVIQLRPFFKATNKEFDDFLCATFDAIRYDPYIEGIFFYVHSLPEDIQIRNRLLVDGLVVDHLYKAVEMKDISVDAELARSLWPNRKPVKAIPLSQFLIGQILTLLFDEYYHCREIDSVKMAGSEESVEKLRETRIYNNSEGTVYDYSPLFKKTLKQDRELILEVFTEEQFKFQIKYLSERLDEILCSYIQKQEPDPRPAIFFGKECSTFDLTIRYKTEEHKIPFRLLAKYKALINSIASDFSLSKKISKKSDSWKKDEKAEAMAGLFKGAITWNGKKGPVANWLERIVKWHLCDVVDEDTTTALQKERLEMETHEYGPEIAAKGFKKRIPKGKLESSGGSLDDEIIDKSGKVSRRSDLLKAEIPTPEEMLLDKEDPQRELAINILKEYPVLERILKKEEEGVALIPAERQSKKRAIDKIKNKYLKN